MAKISELIGKLTLEEKAALCSGLNSWETTPVKRLGIPHVMMTDGPHGLRKEKDEEGITNIFKGSYPATCFPPAVTIASSWDLGLAEKIGEAIAEEAISQGVTTVLGPGINIKRSPLCGRNFEYFSEDPLLTGEMAASYIKGVQRNGVGTSLKHYAVNNQEYRRLTISSEVDERALREIYLRAFEIAVKKSQPATIMCSYNLVNGVYASENRRLLTDILRDEWGFKGIVVSDWGAVNDRVKGISAGLDLEMPSSNGYNDSEIVKAVRAGLLDEKDLDTVVERILGYVFDCDAVRKNYLPANPDYDAHHELAREAAASGAVLLKNEGALLPIEKNSSFAVVGRLSSEIRYQGSGSSRLTPRKLVSFTDYLNELGVRYSYAPGYGLSGDGYDKKMIEEAVEVVKDKDYVLVFAGLTDEYESEGFDRKHLAIPRGHNELIKAICRQQTKVIVVLSCGSPVEMPWVGEVDAILNLYLGGEAGGEAAYDIIFGNVSPSGKLAETFPLKIDHCLASKYFGMGPKMVQYRESIFVGYRYYDSAEKKVLFPFGFGLSYTDFGYSDLQVDNSEPVKNDGIELSFTLSNKGFYDGSEIVQVYVRDLNPAIFKPFKELKGFKKVFLRKGESKEVSLRLDRDDFSFYNTNVSRRHLEEGDYEIMIGSSSREIRLATVVHLTGDEGEVPVYSGVAPVYYNMSGVEGIPLAQFEGLLGRKLPEEKPPLAGSLDLNSTVADLDVTLFGTLFKKAVYRFCTKILPEDAAGFEKVMVREGAVSMPLRSFYSMSGGALSYRAVSGLLKAFNGKILRGLYEFSKEMLTQKAPRKTDIYLK